MPKNGTKIIVFTGIGYIEPCNGEGMRKSIIMGMMTTIAVST